MKVAVLSGGRSSEHDVSIASGEAVEQALTKSGYQVEMVKLNRDGSWSHRGEKLPLEPGSGLLNCDVVFPVLHGPFGEDGTVQGLLELLDVPYVGADVLSSALAMNKAMFKDVLATRGIPQVKYRVITVYEWARRREQVFTELLELGLPQFVKPARLGSSIGMSKAKSEEDLLVAVEEAFRHDSVILSEQFCPGIEIECAVIGGSGEPFASLPGRIHVLISEWYDYTAKYSEGGMSLEVPADIPEGITERVRQLACKTFRIADVNGLARVDFFVDGDEVLVNELNTIPGFTGTSVFAQLMAATGINFSSVCERLIEFAVERYRNERANREF